MFLTVNTSLLEDEENLQIERGSELIVLWGEVSWVALGDHRTSDF